MKKPLLLTLATLCLVTSSLGQPVITQQPLNQTNLAGTTAIFTVVAGFQPASKAASLPPVSQRKKTISPDSLPHEREVNLQQALAAKRPLIGSVMTTSGRVWAATWQTIRSKPGCADVPKMGRGAARIPQPRRFLPKRSGT